MKRLAVPLLLVMALVLGACTPGRPALGRDSPRPGAGRDCCAGQARREQAR